MVEALLLTVFVGAIVLLMRSISRPVAPGARRSLGLFSYSEMDMTDTNASNPKST